MGGKSVSFLEETESDSVHAFLNRTRNKYLFVGTALIVLGANYAYSASLQYSPAHRMIDGGRFPYCGDTVFEAHASEESKQLANSLSTMTISELLKFIRSETNTVKEYSYALNELSRHRDDVRCISSLFAMTTNPACRVKASVVLALGYMLDENAVPQLLDLFALRDGCIDIPLYGILGWYRDKRTRGILLEGLKCTNSAERALAALSLAYSGALLSKITFSEIG
jgi:hypothetical protein